MDGSLVYLIVAAVGLAVVSGFWYSYYQSVQALRAHDRETARLMEEAIANLRTSGAPDETISAAQYKLDQFRATHRT
ncbi:MAG TPA: hypothetical protein VE869_18365 [Gemmatimonas sp.]|nr:hypothetical protein [Gemmatimonas sp.]